MAKFINRQAYSKTPINTVGGNHKHVVTTESATKKNFSEADFQQGSKRRFIWRLVSLLALIFILVLTSSRLQADTGNCSGTTITLPFTDVMGNPFFCHIAQIYAQGITAGTSPTTLRPDKQYHARTDGRLHRANPGHRVTAWQPARRSRPVLDHHTAL